MLKSDQLQQVITKTLEVKPYLSIKNKKNLIDTIVNHCILFEDGVFKFNEIDKAEVEYYMSCNDIECAMTICNKSNEEIIVLTNSNVGFYEFLDVLKEINKVK